jgi:hypothetical protein
LGKYLTAGVATVLGRVSHVTDVFVCLYVCLYVGLFVSFFVFLQILLTNTKILDKSFEYEYLHPWLGKGLLTSTGMLV